MDIDIQNPYKDLNQVELNKHLFSIIHNFNEIDSAKKLQDVINAGAELNIVDEEIKTTPLILACQKGHSVAVQILLKNNACPNFITQYTPNPPLMVAAQAGYIDCVKLLVMNGAIIDTQLSVGINALMFAASQGHSHIVHYLITQGANINATTQSNRTALNYAMERHDIPTQYFLLSATSSEGLDNFAEKNPTCKTAINTFKQELLNNRTKLFKTLLHSPTIIGLEIDVIKNHIFSSLLNAMPDYFCELYVKTHLENDINLFLQLQPCAKEGFLQTSPKEEFLNTIEKKGQFITFSPKILDKRKLGLNHQDDNPSPTKKQKLND